MENISQRDAFWGRIYEIAKQDKDVVLVIADMGAPALDKFRIELSAQYIDVGIAEQQGVAVASGLVLSGKKAFVYAIAPFIALRCYEHTRVNLASMNLPVTLVGVGAGVSYDDSGPTHHAVDDISVLRILPNLKIYNATDSVMAKAFADMSCKLDHPNYVRLDRKVLPTIYDKNTDFSTGITELASGSDVCIIATGNMVHRALHVSEDLKKNGIKAGVVDVYMFPINEDFFVNKVKDAAQIVTLEEHTLPGGLGSAVCEVLCDKQLLKPVKRIGMNFKTGYCYKYGGRDNIQSLYGLDKKSIVQAIMSQLKGSYVCKK
jgi:transketolase